MSARLARRDVRRPPRRAALARRRPRRRHDAARQAALEARSRRARRARRARCPHGVALVSATNGKTTTTAMASAILSPPRRLAWNNSGANLASGVASTLLAARDAELGLLEVDEFALPEVMRRDAAARRRARQPLPRPARPLRRARAHRRALARRRGRALPPTTTLVVNADDPLVAELADGRGACSAVRRRRPAPRPRRPPARGRLEVLRPLRPPVPLRRRLRRPPRRLPLRGLRPRTAPARRRGAGDRPAGARGVAFVLVTPARGRARAPRRCPVSTTSTTRSPRRRLCLALGVSLDEIVAGLERFRAAFGRFERIAAGDRSVLLLLIKNPAGANEAVRTLEDGGVPRDARRRAQRPDRRRSRRLVDLGRRLRAAARARRADRRQRRAGGRARPPVHVRRPSRATGSRSSPTSRRRSTAGSR